MNEWDDYLQREPKPVRIVWESGALVAQPNRMPRLLQAYAEYLADELTRILFGEAGE